MPWLTGGENVTKVRVKTGFVAEKLKGSVGQELDIQDENLLSSLENAQYVERIESATKKPKKSVDTHENK